MNEFLKGSNARWLVPVLVGVVLCLCSCALLWVLWPTVILPIPAGMDPADAYEYGYEAGLDNPLIGAYPIFAIICPLALLVLGGVVAYFVVNRYQKNNPPPSNPMT